MAIESPVRYDFSVLELFIQESGKRLENMMKYIREELEKKYTKNMSWEKEKSYLNDGLCFYDYDPKIIQSWVILNSHEYDFIGQGICYPDEKDEFEWRTFFQNLPKVPFVFVCIASEGKRFRENYKNILNLRPVGWDWNDKIDNENSIDEVGIKYLNLSDMLSFEKDSTIEIYKFIETGFGEVQELIDQCIYK